MDKKATREEDYVAANVAISYAAVEDFRKAFDKNPKDAVEKLIGRKIPAEIVVHRNDSEHLHIALPSDSGASPLSPGELSAVSGGGVPRGWTPEAWKAHVARCTAEWNANVEAAKNDPDSDYG